MTTEETRCPLCGGPIDEATLNNVAEIHRQIRALQARLEQLDQRLDPVSESPGLTGGYGADDSFDEEKN